MTGLGSDRICFVRPAHSDGELHLCRYSRHAPLRAYLPAAEGFVACSGQNHYIDILALAAVIQGVADFRSGGGVNALR